MFTGLRSRKRVEHIRKGLALMLSWLSRVGELVLSSWSAAEFRGSHVHTGYSIAP